MCFLSPIITHTNILHQLVGKKTTLKSGSVLYSDFSVAKTSEYFLVLILLDLSPAFNKAIHSPLETVYSPGLCLVFFDISALSFVFFFPSILSFLGFLPNAMSQGSVLTLCCPNSHSVCRLKYTDNTSRFIP